MEIKMILLVACSVAAAAIAVVTGFLENKKTRFIVSAALPLILILNTFYPPIYIEISYYVAAAAYMVIQAITASLNTKWMRISTGIALACIELVLCVLLYRYCSLAYFDHPLHF